MSGTSGDGVDAVAIRLQSADVPHEPELLGHAYEAFPSDLQHELTHPTSLSVPRVAELHFTLPEIYSRAVQKLPRWSDAACCGMHGQTIWHQPPSRLRDGEGERVACTLQIGSSAVLAMRLGMPVIGDLRGLDIAAGGEGAPIVPYAHWFFTPPQRRPCIVVNLGGIANASIVRDASAEVEGYDVGPGMMISNAHAATASAGRLDCDLDGALSAGGQLIPDLLGAILAHPFLQRQPPKSTGREEFGEGFYAPVLARFASQRTNDVAFTLLAATAETLGRTIERFAPDAAREILLTGGGAKNPTLVELVQRRMQAVPVTVAHHGVLSASCHEPAAVALFAARTLIGLPSSLPRVTGARHVVRLGHVQWP